jgi:cytochrome b involved in lipid metabolism
MSYTRQQVAEHNSDKSAWIIIDTVVYDITKFASLHPGGELLLLEYAGKDVRIHNAGDRGILLFSSARSS